MKIIEAISDMNIGGAGILLLTRLEHSPEYLKQTTVVLPKGSKLCDRLEALNVHYVEVDGNYDRSFDFKSIFKCIRLIRSVGADIVNCHGCLSVRIAAFLTRVPVRLYTKHCVFPIKPWQKNFIYRYAYRTVQLLLSQRVIAVAYAARDDLVSLGIPADRIDVIINGVGGVRRISVAERLAVREMYGIPADVTVVGIFARLEEYKGHTDFLDAAAYILRKSRRYRFLIVGDGSAREALTARVSRLGISKYVIFTRFIEDVAPLMNIVDINVNCSWGPETSSLALSEGMSLGIPCIASEYGGNTYMVKNGKNGFTYPIGDHVSLARRIILLSRSNRVRSKLSEGARLRFETELNAEKMCRQTYDLYNDLACRQGIDVN